MKKFEEKTITTETIYQGKIIDLQVDEVELSRTGRHRNGN